MDTEIYSSYSTLQSVFKRAELDVANGFCHPSKNGVDVPLDKFFLYYSLSGDMDSSARANFRIYSIKDNVEKWKSGNVKPELGIESWGGESLEAERSKGSG